MSASTCSTCGTKVPPGAARCPGCGSVFGEANRCPHCHAIAAVRASNTGYVCMACNKPRQLVDGTTIVDDPAPLITPRTRAAPQVVGQAAAASGAAATPQHVPPRAVSRSAGTGYRALGIFAIAGGVLAAAAAAILIPGVGGFLVAAALGGSGAGVGALSLRAAARAQENADHSVAASTELAILALAEKSEGVLTVTDVSRGLGISAQQAEAALGAMTDGSRISAELTTDGFVKYVFRELRAKGQPEPRVRARVEAEAEPTGAPAEMSEELAEAHAEVEAMLKSDPDA